MTDMATADIQFRIMTDMKVALNYLDSLMACWCLNKVSPILIKRNVLVHLSDPAYTTLTQPSFSQQKTISRNNIMMPHLITCIDYMFQYQ
jgi:hypothetical protein